jgi:hypothetical protein
MGLRMSTQSRRELFDSIRPQYQKASRKEKQSLLTGLLAATGLSRKHAIGILNKAPARMPFDDEKRSMTTP